MTFLPAAWLTEELETPRNTQRQIADAMKENLFLDMFPPFFFFINHSLPKNPPLATGPFPSITSFQILLVVDKSINLLPFNVIDKISSLSLQETPQILLKDGKHLISVNIAHSANMGCNNDILHFP